MKKLLSLLLCMLFASTAALAGDLTPAQSEAQRALYKYLYEQKFDPVIDDSDNSVTFTSKGVLYWITLDGDSPILYTFHRKGFKVGEDDKSYKRVPAAVAVNEVNRKHKAVKLTVEDKSVVIAMQVYAAKTSDFIAVLKNYLSMFDGVDTDFRSAYETALAEQKKNEEITEQEIRKALPPSELQNMIDNVSFRIVDVDGKAVTDYDQPLRSFKAHYVQARVELNPWQEKEKKYTLQIKITRPNGKVIVAGKDKKVSGEMEIIPVKSKKNQFFEFDKIGSDNDGFWKAGEYKVEILESGDVVKETTFNLL